MERAEKNESTMQDERAVIAERAGVSERAATEDSIEDRENATGSCEMSASRLLRPKRDGRASSR